MGKKIITSVPWWLRAIIAMVLLVLLVGGAIVLQKLLDFEFTKQDIFYSLLCIVGIVFVSSIVGAVVALLTASQKISNAEEKLEGKMRDLKQQTDAIQTVAQKVSDNLQRYQKGTELLNNIIASAKEISRIALERFGKSIITYHGLIEIENSVEKDGEIWVLTSALELEGVELKQTIRDNFKKNIRYTYLIPKEDKVLQNRMINLAKEWKSDCSLSAEDAQRQIKCVLVPKHFAYMTVIVYNPYKVPPTVLVKFPTSRIYEKEKYPLIYRVDTAPKQAWKVFLDSMQELIDTEGECPFVEALELDFS